MFAEWMALFLLVSYHGIWFWMLWQAPLRTSNGFNSAMRREWVETIHESGQAILAVQTLRNWTMAASFLASTAILLALGVLNFWFGQSQLQLPEWLEAQRSHPWFWDLKLWLLCLTLLTSFFHFSLSIRSYNHVAFLMCIPQGRSKAANPDCIYRHLRRGTLSYTIGMRLLYLSSLAALWLFGGVPLLVGSAILLIMLSWLDYSI